MAAACGVAVYYILTIPFLNVPETPAPVITGTGSGSGKGFCRMNRRSSADENVETGQVQITSKPQARYTDDARQNSTEGTVRLKVTLLADGTVGSITPVTTLPDGLTEQAIAAARSIKFEPKKVDGVPVSTTVTVDYSFDIY